MDNQDKSSKYDPVPIIALSAVKNSLDMTTYTDAGLNYFLAKPVQFHKLKAIIEHFINRIENESIVKNIL